MAIDFSPLYRNTVGFDRMFSLLDSALRTEPAAGGYPPYNIEVTDENRYAITLAVAGFSRDEVDIEVERDVLSVRGRKADVDNRERQYLYQGIAARSFERKFNLAEHMEVTGAELNNGLLTIHLVKHIPEEMKPKRIEIDGGTGEVLEHKSKDTKETKAA